MSMNVLADGNSAEQLLEAIPYAVMHAVEDARRQTMAPSEKLLSAISKAVSEACSEQFADFPTGVIDLRDARHLHSVPVESTAVINSDD
ncbi:MAG TPA: hypothetical protein VLE74_02595 [Candidatus Saccharimonadales bacterium]|nr:hypothetical protein [Candidatus Saccharimonadales bacterium]